jgi:hypothetical protein
MQDLESEQVVIGVAGGGNNVERGIAAVGKGAVYGVLEEGGRGGRRRGPLYSMNAQDPFLRERTREVTSRVVLDFSVAERVANHFARRW